ncbi:MAG: glutamate/gamma-aminobutyrate family transporter YjeM [Bacilli bacterium]|jgi:amino acid transporter|nr:glutamate/gamma-aminobutyrate family transporter YjeM [Bacilli bacterium]
MSQSTKGKLSLVALSLMIFTSVYGFNNIPRAFFKMGYGAIPWYIIGGLFFFIPFAFMVTELGSAFKKEKGGIYSWMSKAVGPTYAFIGTFMWYASYIIWMVSISNTILVPLSNVIFGTTKLPSTFIVSIIAAIFMIIVTFLSIKGLDSIKRVASVGGIAVLALNVILILGAVIVLIAHGGQFATPINLHSFVSSPNPTFSPSLVAFIAFMVYAIFAYGGVESVGGLVDQTDKPEKNFPKGIIISALIITVGYSVAILCVGFFVNYGSDWTQGIKDNAIHLGNIGYVMMSNLGNQVGLSLGMNASSATFLGEVLARFTGISMFLAYMGAFFTLIYSPAKQIIEGTPEKLWPGKLGQIEDNMPKHAMKLQCLIVIIIIGINALISLADEGAASMFFEVLTNMSNVSMTLPYLFIIYAFYRFKKNKDIEKPFTIINGKIVITLLTIVVMIVVGFANLFSIVQPFVDYFQATFATQAEQSAAFASALRTCLSMVGGPIIFALIAYFLMRRYNKNYKNNNND